MEPWEMEVHAHRILAGTTRIRLGGREVHLKPPTIGMRLAASELHRDLLEEGHLAGLLTNEDAVDLLRRRGIWAPEDDRQHRLLGEKLEDLKVGLYENWTHSNNRFLIRNAIHKGRAELARLDGVKHSLDHVTCEGVAAAGRVRYLTGLSLVLPDGSPLWPAASAYDEPDEVLDDVIEYLVRARLGEGDVREICRNDPWRSYWSARKFAGRGLIDVAAVDFTDEQRYVMMWSNVYDSIRESPDCPDDSIIEDDDMLDGWMIKQKRERDSQRAKKRGDEVANEKIRNAHEVYIPADTAEDARKIERLNDSVASTIKAQRLAHLKSRGEVPEMQMPDTWSRFQQEASQAISDRIKAQRGPK